MRIKYYFKLNFKIGAFFWNFWEDAEYFSLDYLL